MPPRLSWLAELVLVGNALASAGYYQNDKNFRVGRFLDYKISRHSLSMVCYMVY